MEPGERTIREIKPVLTGYINKSSVLINRTSIPDEETVHDIRVLMKKGRAVLKLFIPLLENEVLEKDYQSLKSVGRIMSDWRDTSVHRKTLKGLRKELPGIYAALSANEKIRSFMQKPESLTEPDEKVKKEIAEIENLLTKTRYRIRFSQMYKIDAADLLRQLELSYEIVRKIYLESRNRPDPDNIHEFRKRAKDFLYQLYFFRPLKPNVIKSLERKLEKITLSLGNYNDLYQLIEALGYNYPDESNQPALDEMILKIRDKQDSYLSKVWPTAYKCFCPGTKFINLLGLKKLTL